jgi:hypothetical protein
MMKIKGALDLFLNGNGSFEEKCELFEYFLKTAGWTEKELREWAMSGRPLEDLIPKKEGDYEIRNRHYKRVKLLTEHLKRRLRNDS